MFDNDRLLLRVLLFGLFGASPWMLVPLWSALLWVAVPAFASRPLTCMLMRLLGGRESLAAGLLTLGWIVLVVLSLTWLGFGLADNARSLTELLKSLQVEGLSLPSSWMADVLPIGDRLIGWWNSIGQQGVTFFYVLKPYASEVGNWLSTRSVEIGGGILELVLSLILVFFFYRDGPRLKSIVHRALERLIGNRAEHYRDLVAGTVQRVVNGAIDTVAAQALPAQIGFTTTDVSEAMLLGLLAFVCSLLMVPPLVQGSATAWLFFRGDYGHGVFLGLWGSFTISGADNILKPYSISRGGNLPLMVVLLGVFDGLLVFGLMGLFLGPILLAVAYNLLSDWIVSTPRTSPGEGRGLDA